MKKLFLAVLFAGLFPASSALAGGFTEATALGGVLFAPSKPLGSDIGKPAEQGIAPASVPAASSKQPPPNKGDSPPGKRGDGKGEKTPGKRADDERQRRLAQHFSSEPPELNRFERVPHVDATAQMVGLFLRFASVSLSRW